jgi:hypothetical protein
MEQNEIINAKKARNLTREVIQKDDTVLYLIMDKIRAAIQKKEYSLVYREVLHHIPIHRHHQRLL